MRLRNLKNKDEILLESQTLVLNSKEKKNKWSKHFGNDKPIHLEIGMGKGDFIIAKALANPEINFLGMEKYDSVIARAVQKMPEYIDNLCLIRASAEDIEEIFAKEIDTIYLNFSDPWPKKRHAERRLSSNTFLAKYSNVFKGSEKIIQKTDSLSLFEFSLINYSQNKFTIEELSLDLHNSRIENNIMTEYEKKFIGQVIYYVSVKK